MFFPLFYKRGQLLRLHISQNWNSILEKGANSFSKEPMTTKKGSEFGIGKAIMQLLCSEKNQMLQNHGL